MSEQVLIDAIKTDRTHEVDRQFIADIAKNGLRVPILVDQDMVLIDGLRRLDAVNNLAYGRIEAIVATTYEEAMAGIELAHGKANPLTDWRRGWEIIQATQDLLDARAARLRRKMAGVPLGQRGTVPKEPKSRELFDVAMGSYQMTRAAEIYRAASAGSARAKDLVRQLEAGEIMPNTAVFLYQKRNLRLRGTSRDAREQRHILSESVRGLAALVKGMKKINPDIEIPPEDLGPILKELQGYKTDLYLIIKQLKKGNQTND